jgi:hypothetical protein
MSNLISLLCLGLIFHQLIGYLVDGKHYFTNHIAPTFNIHFNKKVKVIIHAVFTGLCVGCIFYPVNAILIAALFIGLTFVIISYPVRLSNHLILAWFILISILASSLIHSGESVNSKIVHNLITKHIQVILSLMYFFSALHKINSDYLSKDLSCGWHITSQYLDEVKVKIKYVRKLILNLSIYGVIAIELLLSLLVFHPNKLFFLTALSLHMLWGFLCHVHFSTIIYSCLVIFIKIDFTLSLLSWATIVCSGVLISLILGNAKTYYNSTTAKMMYAVFGVISIFMFYNATSINMNTDFKFSNGSEIASLIFVSVLVMANNISPYLGIKTEFSFAMFSNLRPDTQTHLFFRKNIMNLNRQEYIELKKISQLPKFKNKISWDYDFAIVAITKENIKLSSYLFLNCLSIIQGNMDDNDILDITFDFEGEYYTLNITNKSKLELINSLFRSWKANFYPIILPVDKKKPICK